MKYIFHLFNTRKIQSAITNLNLARKTYRASAVALLGYYGVFKSKLLFNRFQFDCQPCC